MVVKGCSLRNAVRKLFQFGNGCGIYRETRMDKGFERILVFSG